MKTIDEKLQSLKNVIKYAPYNYLRKFCECFTRDRYVKLYRSLDLSQTSIISSDCVGGIIYHDAGCEFQSPTINMRFEASDMVKLCSNLRYYMQLDPVPYKDSNGVSYPVLELGDIKLWCVHYHTYEEAIIAWQRRKKRINYKNIVMLFSEKDNFSEDLIDKIDKIPGKKVLFAAKSRPYEWNCYIPEFEKNGMVMDLTRYASFWGIKWYEKHFNMVGWLNGKKIDACINANRLAL